MKYKIQVKLQELINTGESKHSIAADTGLTADAVLVHLQGRSQPGSRAILAYNDAYGWEIDDMLGEA